MLPPPPSSTLFPYTTLFRSALIGLGVALVLIAVEYMHLRKLARERAERRHVPAELDDTERRRLASDRKSTRLNSSHEWISYAVFCLKKKKVKYMDDYCARNA